MIPQIIPFALFGGICGIAWAFALDKSLKNGIIAGVIIGAILGLLIYLMGKAASARGNVTTGERKFVSASLGAALIWLSIIGAAVTWVVRVIFF